MEAVRLFECKALGTFRQQRGKQRMSDLNSGFMAVKCKRGEERHDMFLLIL